MLKSFLKFSIFNSQFSNNFQFFNELIFKAFGNLVIRICLEIRNWKLEFFENLVFKVGVA